MPQRENLGRRTKKLPPGPPGWPIIGNIFDLGTEPHRALQELKLKYGPVLRLRLGSMDTVVIQSAKAAAQLLKNHDASFCDRKPLDVFTCHNYRDGSLAVGRFSPYWRTVRRLCSVEMMTVKRINDTASIRRKCIDQMIRNIEDDTAAANARGESGVVNLPHYLFLMAFNVIGNLMLSRDLLDSQCKEGYEFVQATGMAAMWAGTPNVADFLPFLKWFDPQGLRRNMSRDMARALKIVEGFVKERLEEYKLGNEEKNNKDFLDTLLEFEGDGKDWHEKIPYERIIIIILEMFFAGSETTSAATEWAMAELLRKPEAMRKEETQILGRSLTFKPERFLGSNIDYKGQNFELIPFGSGRRICIDSGLFFSLEKIMWASGRRKVLTGSMSASLMLPRRSNNSQYVDSHGYLRFPVGSSPVRVDPSISILRKAFSLDRPKTSVSPSKSSATES
ncbi:hypothetical protein GH714_026576 [Hevea brasiliensis]|uniref:Cytochrome P450 n=1 Tax=Hevea brasiliensis TaxID=3981 RepID=A0A6A6N4N3_HEVBR|nr:hypothetical protein GH714_026576 [Hevea brasiliensis]